MIDRLLNELHFPRTNEKKDLKLLSSEIVIDEVKFGLSLRLRPHRYRDWIPIVESIIKNFPRALFWNSRRLHHRSAWSAKNGSRKTLAISNTVVRKLTVQNSILKAAHPSSDCFFKRSVMAAFRSWAGFGNSCETRLYVLNVCLLFKFDIFKRNSAMTSAYLK